MHILCTLALSSTDFTILAMFFSFSLLSTRSVSYSLFPPYFFSLYLIYSSLSSPYVLTSLPHHSLALSLPFRRGRTFLFLSHNLFCLHLYGLRLTHLLALYIPEVMSFAECQKGFVDNLHFFPDKSRDQRGFQSSFMKRIEF